MKKILLSIGAFSLLLGAQVNAQTYLFETFDSQGAGWTNVDSDGDGQKWFVFEDAVGNQGNVMTSASWSSSPLNPDNLLISPAIQLGTTNLTLSFKVRGQDPDWSEEHYAVYVTTSNNVSTIKGSNPVLEENLPPNTSSYLTKTVDLSSFANQTVYVTFRHYNSTDWFRINIDDIIVGEAPQYEVALMSTDVPSGATAGNVNIKGLVKNIGAKPITNLDVSYDAGSGVVNANIPNLNIAPGATYTFTHPTPLAVSTGNTYSINICATTAGDGDAGNNCKTATIDFVVSESVEKFALVEEKTGTWCGWCPRGTVALDKIAENEPKAITIAIHNSDPMAVSAYDNGTKNLPDFSGYPYAAVDRVIGLDPSQAQQGVNVRKALPAPARLSFKDFTIDATTISVTAKVNMVTNLSGNYGLAVALIEDSVKGTGNTWLQVNYYSGYADLIASNGVNWKNLPEKADQSAVFGGYNHVARAIGGNNVNGDPNSLPGTLTAGNHYEYTYTFNRSTSWDIDKMSAVAMLVDKSNGEILNAGQSTLDATLSVNNNKVNEFDLEVFPNPNKGQTNFAINLSNTSEVSLKVFNTIGEVVHEIPTETLASGAHIYSMNLDVPSGFYFANISIDGKIIVKKINIVK